MSRQQTLLDQRYDLANRADAESENVRRGARPFRMECESSCSPAPGTVARHSGSGKTLAETSGETLDAKYLASQIMDHQKTVNLLLWHLSYGQNEQLRAYSTETLPVVMHHLQMAKDLQARLTLMNQHPRG